MMVNTERALTIRKLKIRKYNILEYINISNTNLKLTCWFSTVQFSSSSKWRKKKTHNMYIYKESNLYYEIKLFNIIKNQLFILKRSVNFQLT